MNRNERDRLTVVCCACLAVASGCSDSSARTLGVPAAASAPTIATTAGAAELQSEAARQQGADGPSAATLPLPVNETYAGASTAFKILSTGTYRVAEFIQNNANNLEPTLRVTHNGGSQAIYASQLGSGVAVWATAAGTGVGKAARFQTTSTSANSPVVDMFTSGASQTALNINSASNGNLLVVSGTGAGGANINSSATASSAGIFNNTSANAAPALRVWGSSSSPTMLVQSYNAASSAINVQASGGIGVLATNSGAGYGVASIVGGSTTSAGEFLVTNAANPSAALEVSTAGTGWAATFTGTGANSKGVLVTTSGGAGLQVVGGSKNAVVATSSGARALYTEESSEVWFTDYGSARLKGDRLHVAFDPIFAETVAADQTYHVFVQPYGSAELFVSNRTRRGFEVMLREGERDVEFSYRVVAKRRGFEGKRLERAPWADKSVRGLRDER